MKILITGGCGFIGSHIVEHHLKAGDSVRIIDDLSTGSLNNVKELPHASFLKIDKYDINACPDLDEAVSWADRIYHMAAVVGVFHVLSNPVKLFKTNVNGIQLLLDVIMRNKVTPRLMIASSSSVYGHSEKPMLNENDNLILLANDHPLRGYAISKITSEILTTSYARLYDLPFTLMRIFNTIGPRQSGQYGMVVPRFVSQACQNLPITIFGDGTQTRSFCDVRDTVAMITQLANTNEAIGQVINIGNDSETSINDLAQIVKETAQSASIFEYLDYQKAYGQALSDIAQRHPDISKLKSLIHYKHQWTLQKTVKDLIERFHASQDKNQQVKQIITNL